jgi:hypothetical protein
VIATGNSENGALLMTAKSADDARARAEARFNRELQRSRQDDALKAEIAAEVRTVDKKTARLKAQRLEKEAAAAKARWRSRSQGQGEAIAAARREP